MMQNCHFNKDGQLVKDKPTQLQRLLAVTSDGAWRTLLELVERIGGISECGVSARLRQARHEGWLVEKRRVAPKSAMYTYRVTKSVQRDLFKAIMVSDPSTLSMALEEAKARKA